METLIKNGWIITMNDEDAVHRKGNVYIKDCLIQDVFEDEDTLKRYDKPHVNVIDASNKLVLPGLINSHSHLFQTFMRGLSDDKPLWRWLKEDIWPFALSMTEEDFYLAALVGCIENLKNGATSVTDQHYIYTSKNNFDMVAEAVKDSEIRGNISRCFVNQNSLPQFMEDDNEILNQLARVVKKWHEVNNDKIRVSVGPLNPWGCSADILKKSKEFADAHNLLYQIHTAETNKVVESTIENYGLRNVELFNDIGILNESTQLVHSVWLNDTELDMVAKSGASVVHCPVANMYLASGVAPINKMTVKGIPVCLATDGPGSNNSQDMVSVLKYTACLQKVHTLDSTVLSPTHVIEMATRNAAVVNQRSDLGQIKQGYQADIVLIDYLKPHISPIHNPKSALVYNCNGNDVDTVIVQGKVVVEGGKMVSINERDVLIKAQERIERLRYEAERNYNKFIKNLY